MLNKVFAFSFEGIASKDYLHTMLVMGEAVHVRIVEGQNGEQIAKAFANAINEMEIPYLAISHKGVVKCTSIYNGTLTCPIL